MRDVEAEKQPYEPPRLFVEGAVTDLTAGAATDGIDNEVVGSL